MCQEQQRVCPECGTTFRKKRPNQVYCSRLCVSALARRSKRPVQAVVSTCEGCGASFTPRMNKRTIRFCSVVCARKHDGRARTKPRQHRPCVICGAPVTFYPDRKDNKATCSRACGNTLAGQKRSGQKRSEQSRQRSSESLRRVHDPSTERGRRLRQASSDRMRANNPFLRPGVAEKARTTKRIRGTLHVWAGERGGNGKLTMPQRLLSAALAWPTEVSILTGCAPRRGGGFPTCYKVDIGNRELKIAIEVDGKGHSTERNRRLDEKKMRKLAELGWRVLRFTNEAVMTSTSEVLSVIEREVAATRSSTT